LPLPPGQYTLAHSGFTIYPVIKHVYVAGIAISTLHIR
jgi:malate/lactate dehydrogenase